jgi:hypothetical protein
LYYTAVILFNREVSKEDDLGVDAGKKVDDKKDNEKSRYTGRMMIEGACQAPRYSTILTNEGPARSSMVM